MEFKKNDLKHGQIIETRNGNKYTVFKSLNEILFLAKNYKCLHDYNYTDDLFFIGSDTKECKEYDIMNVYEKRVYNPTMLKKYEYELIWHREIVIKMTLEDVCKDLGAKIEIVEK